MTRFGNKPPSREYWRTMLVATVLTLRDNGKLDTLNLRDWSRKTGWPEERVFQRANEIARERREVSRAG